LKLKCDILVSKFAFKRILCRYTERGTDVAGARGYFLKGAGVLLNQAGLALYSPGTLLPRMSSCA
jgi:hypothetical protein